MDASTENDMETMNAASLANSRMIFTALQDSSRGCMLMSLYADRNAVAKLAILIIPSAR